MPTCLRQFDAPGYFFQTIQFFMSQSHIIDSNEAFGTDVRLEEPQVNQRPVTLPQHIQSHIQIGQLIKSLVYGGVDGTTNTLVIILSSLSAGIPARNILVYALSFCIGDAISMGLGDYLSAKAEIGYIKSEEEREYYEVEHLLEDQKKEIIEIYKKKGYSTQEASRVAELYSTNKQAFVNIMMLEELQLVVIDPRLALKCGIVTFFSFIIFGILPVLPYIVTSGILKRDDQPWVASVCIGASELLGLGLLKATILGLNKWRAGVEFLFVGAAAVGAGYGLGFAFSI